MNILLIGILVFLLAYLIAEDFPGISLFLLVFYTYIFLATFFFGVSLIPTSSMSFTTPRGEMVLIQKSYGTVPYSSAAGLWYRYKIYAPSWRVAKPKAGDVVAFITSPQSRIEYLKRVIAVEGDKVQFINGKLILNNIPCTYEYIKIKEYYSDEQRLVKYDIYKETTPAGHSRQIAIARPQNVRDQLNFYQNDNTKATVVPTGHIYYVGDNREGSGDSRHYGTIPIEYVTGKAIISLAKGYHFAPYMENIEDAYGMGPWALLSTILLIIAALLSALVFEFENIGTVIV